jgi:hypothetical protein
MITALTVLLSLAAGQAGAAQPSEAELRDRIEAYLGAIDRPISSESWRSLGPAAAPILEDLATSRGQLRSRRAKALEGLTAIGGPRAEAVNLRIAQDAKEPAYVRTTAVQGVARLFPADRAVKELRPLLEQDQSPAVRVAAADALARQAPSDACGAIRAQAHREGERGANLYHRALRRCGE